MSEHTIEPFDGDAATDEELRAFWRFTTMIDGEIEPDVPAAPFEVFVQRIRNQPSWRTVHHWVVWNGARDEVVAQANLELAYREDNRDQASSFIAVHPDLRRDHLGRRLAAVVGDAAAADGRSTLNFWSLEGTAADGFLEALGAETRSTERKSGLDLSAVDREMLVGWVERARDRAVGYELIGFDDRCPDDLVEEFNALSHVMNTAPRDDLEMEDFVFTTEQFREDERLMLERGISTWKLIARRTSDGALGGFTELYFAPWEPDRCDQGNTGVRPEHRNLGLGRWLKAAMLLRLMEERPEVGQVVTWNAFSNEPMLAINVAMGFEILQAFRNWQVQTETLRKRSLA